MATSPKVKSLGYMFGSFSVIMGRLFVNRSPSLAEHLLQQVGDPRSGVGSDLLLLFSQYVK